MRRVLVAASLLLLVGCSATPAPEPGLDAADVDELRDYLIDIYWASTGLSDDLRPPRSSVTVVDGSDRDAAYVKCMNNAGFDNYDAIPGGGYTIGDASMDDRRDDELIADYVCGTSFEIDGQFDGVYNDAQLDYLYDYYQQILVPCLQVLDYQVAEVPTRAEFSGNWGGWHPYYSVEALRQEAFFEDKRVPSECPPTPAGIADPGFAVFWTQQP